MSRGALLPRTPPFFLNCTRLSALQIWIISRYYGDDVRMSNLLERISHGLQVAARALWP